MGMAVGSSNLYKLLGMHNHYCQGSSLLLYMLTLLAGSKNWPDLLMSSCKDSNRPGHTHLRWECHREKSIVKMQKCPCKYIDIRVYIVLQRTIVTGVYEEPS